MAPKTGMYDDLIEWIKVHEGYRRFAYECSEGRLTIGYGTMIEQGGHGVPEWVAELLLRDYLETLLSLFLTHSWFKQLDDARRSGILSMGYQMGYEGVLGFKRMIDAIKHSDWDRAYSEALDSRWARQTPARAEEVAKRVAYGT